MTVVSCGLFLYSVSSVSKFPMLRVVPVLLLVVLVRADDLVPAGSYIIPTGSYSFMLWTWFLLVVVLFLLVGTTTSTRPPSPTRQTSFQADVREGGGDFVSSPQSNEAPATPVATAAASAEDSAALTALSLKLDMCPNRAAGHDAAEVPSDTTMPFCSTSTTRRRLRKPFTSSASVHVPENIPAGVGIPAAATTIPAGSSMDVAVHVAAAHSSSIPAVDKGKAPMVDDSLHADLLSEQERILKNLHDYHLGEDLAKKLHAE
nr:hypothetical protein [Tanacetum cinerariifolium]